MEPSGLTEVKILVGDLPASPGLSVNFSLNVGDNNTANLRQELKSLSGKDFEPYHCYVMVKCESAQDAELLKERLSERWTAAMAGTDSRPFAAEVKSALKPDEEEVLSLEFSTNNEMLVVKVIPGEEKLMQMEMFYSSILEETAGHILKYDQKLYFELDLGKAIPNVLHSDNLAVEALDSARLLIKLDMKTELAEQIVQVLKDSGVTGYALIGVTGFGLYEHARFNMKFKSMEQLPESVKEMVKLPLQGLNLAQQFNEFPADLKELIQLLIDHAQAEIRVIGGAQLLMLDVNIHAPGISEFYQFN